jgi:putative transposase
MLWARLLAYVTGTVDQELLLRNEYLAEENRILRRGQIKDRLLLSEGEKATLAEIAHRLGRKALEGVAAVAKPDTLLAWYRKLIANKFDGSKFRRSAGRPRVDPETERLVVKMARENPSWGYDRIVGALANLGHRLSDQTEGNVLRRHGISPAPKRKQSISWKNFIRAHRDVLVGMDFFTTEVLTLKGLTTYYVLFFIHLETRRVNLAGFTPYPDQERMEQQARNMTMEEWGSLRGCRDLLHDRDAKFCESFRKLISTGSVNPLRLPARGPNLNSYAERWVRSGQRRMSVDVDSVWRIFAAASIAAISRTLPRGAQSPGPRQPDLVSFAAGSKKEQRSRAVSRAAGRPAEVLRQGSGIRVDGTAGDGFRISTY